MVPRVLRVAAAVADLRIEQALVLELLAERMLHAPEAAGGDGALLDVVGHRRVLRRLLGCQAHALGGGHEGPEEPLHERRHVGRHEDGGEEGEEEDERGAGGELNGC